MEATPCVLLRAYPRLPEKEPDESVSRRPTHCTASHRKVAVPAHPALSGWLQAVHQSVRNIWPIVSEMHLGRREFLWLRHFPNRFLPASVLLALGLVKK